MLKRVLSLFCAALSALAVHGLRQLRPLWCLDGCRDDCLSRLRQRLRRVRVRVRLVRGLRSSSRFPGGFPKSRSASRTPRRSASRPSGLAVHRDQRGGLIALLSGLTCLGGPGPGHGRHPLSIPPIWAPVGRPGRGHLPCVGNAAAVCLQWTATPLCLSHPLGRAFDDATAPASPSRCPPDHQRAGPHSTARELPQPQRAPHRARRPPLTTIARDTRLAEDEPST
jgi:hypothetical protein